MKSNVIAIGEKALAKYGHRSIDYANLQRMVRDEFNIRYPSKNWHCLFLFSLPEDCDITYSNYYMHIQVYGSWTSVTLQLWATDKQ